MVTKERIARDVAAIGQASLDLKRPDLEAFVDKRIVALILDVAEDVGGQEARAEAESRWF